MTGTCTRRTFEGATSAAAVAVLMVAAGPTGTAWAREPLPLRTDAAFQQECLKAHNQFRARHGAPPLRTDPAVVDHARSRATTVSSYEGLQEGHKGLDRAYGENLHWSGSSVSGQVTSCTKAVEGWYAGSRLYDYADGRFSGRTGFFTQVVWKSTTSLGCARAAGQGSEWFETYIVCNYRTPGNVAGAFRTNVLPPTSPAQG